MCIRDSLRRVLVEQARLTDQVQRHIGQGYVLFHDRPVATPFPQPVAQHMAGVPQPQQIAEQGSVLIGSGCGPYSALTVSYTHLRAHETVLDLVCRLLLEKKKKHNM
eukprot:TRINITY_DN6054_c0_g1_i1.p1 TRINITY_DN6054_c0_g1~~TRINITY_DN6054_c0_g1_i1.p1  ORF type:complete len:107 (-),score=46.32 TRINITY_DN6054_c0_g1_i1:40-360(-)